MVFPTAFRQFPFLCGLLPFLCFLNLIKSHHEIGQMDLDLNLSFASLFPIYIYINLGILINISKLLFSIKMKIIYYNVLGGCED